MEKESLNKVRIDLRVERHGRRNAAAITKTMSAAQAINIHCRCWGDRPTSMATPGGGLLRPEDDSPAGKVVRRHFDGDFVAGHDPDEVLTHLPAYMGEN